MLCSNPLPMKANRHQKIKRILAASPTARDAVQTARHTNQLQRMPRMKSSQAGRDILIPATFWIRVACGVADTTPDCTTSHATARDPSKFPRSDHANRAPTCPHVNCLASPPITPIMLLPVNNSDPAKITRVSAMPKDTPITSFSAAGSAGRSK